ncbi:MAG: VacB/RNase II family 3'-5' exoribonuclease [Alphaproteobacteria bacterium]
MTADGDLIAEPVDWPDKQAMPMIVVVSEAPGATSAGIGDRVLAKLSAVDSGYEASVMRRLETPRPDVVVGVLALDEGARDDGPGEIEPLDRRAKGRFRVPRGRTGGGVNGELVRAVLRGPTRGRTVTVEVVERLGDSAGPHGPSLIALLSADIPSEFSPAAVDEAASATPPDDTAREDLRSLPLVTIDDADARDFDDAVWAEADPSADNTGGFHLVVAIADVAWYVRPGSALDAAAQERGNSVYLPDRAIPMLPERLSTDLCSLRPGEDRPCVAVHLWIDRRGKALRHRFVRAVMRSSARLTYEQVQRAADGDGEEVALAPAVAPLYAAFHALRHDRERRGALEIDLPESQVLLDEHGRIRALRERPRHDSHRLIEEFMVAANVAAAVTLETRRRPTLYRVHDAPDAARVLALGELLTTLDVPFPRRATPTTAQFNDLLQRVSDTALADAVNMMVLRTQSQAVYTPKASGHFGLALARYCHFTSPIRRYADLLVHRGLIASLDLATAGEPVTPGDSTADLEALGAHLSTTERRAAVAEREAITRYAARMLTSATGTEIDGRVAGASPAGLYVRLSDHATDGFVPRSRLPAGDYIAAPHGLVGRGGAADYILGDAVTVRLIEANPVTGSIICEIVGEGGGRQSRHRRGPARVRRSTNTGGRRPRGR